MNRNVTRLLATLAVLGGLLATSPADGLLPSPDAAPRTNADGARR